MKNSMGLTGCLSESQLISYLKNELTPAQNREIELHITDCELCSDALEGLRLIKNKDHTTEIVIDLKHKINKKLTAKVKTMPIASHWLQIAAIFMVLFAGIGAYLYIQSFSNNNIALEKSQQTTTETAIESVQPERNSDFQISEKEETLKSNNISVELKKQNLDNSLSAEEDAEENNRSFPVNASAKNEAAMSEAGTIASDDTKKITEKDQNFDSPNTGIASDEEKQEISLSEAPASYESKSSEGVAVAAKINTRTPASVSKETADNTNSNNKYIEIKKNYFLAESYYKTQNYTDALSYYKLVIEAGTSNYFEDALWYSADIKIKQNKKREARNYLELLKSGSKKYKEEATKKLLTL
jgi:hypothetical protein